MIPPEVIIRERSLQELIPRMIERQILRCLLGPHPRRMIHRRQRKDSNQYWKHATSSGDQWKPKLRQDTEMSSVAGDTSDASAATHRLRSIYESEGDAVRGFRSDAGYWR